jgi:hypothetical protein
MEASRFAPRRPRGRQHSPHFDFGIPAATLLLVLLGVTFIESLSALSAESVQAPKARACSTCRGKGEVDCQKCSGDGDVETPCPRCAGQGKLDCARTECEKGQRACRSCGGKGLIREKVLVVQGGFTTRVKPCSTCRGSGFLDCRYCESGKLNCPECRGKKQRLSACAACEGSGRLACPRCAGAEAAPAAAAVESVALDGLAGELRRARAMFLEARRRLEQSREALDALSAAAAGLQAGFDGMRALDGKALSQYLFRLRQNTLVEWGAHQKELAPEAPIRRQIASLLEQVASRLAAVEQLGVEAKQLAARGAGALEDGTDGPLRDLRRRLAELTGAKEDLDLDLYKLGRDLDRLSKESEALQSALKDFDARQEQYSKKQAAEAASKPEPSAAGEPAPEEDRVLVAARELGLPDPSWRPDDDGRQGELRFLDDRASALSPARLSDARPSDDYLRRLPDLVDDAFDAAPKLERLELAVQVRLGGGGGRPPATAQRFTFEREAWLARDESEPRPGWKDLLAASQPSPRFPAVPLPDVEPEAPASGISVKLVVLGILLAIGAACLGYALRARVGRSAMEH